LINHLKKNKKKGVVLFKMCDKRSISVYNGFEGVNCDSLDEGPFLKDHPHMKKLKILFQEAGFGSGFVYETSDTYAAVFQCVYDIRHKTHLISWVNMVRREINLQWGWPIISKPYFLDKYDETNPFITPVIGLHFVPKKNTPNTMPVFKYSL
jgi:hypothetical protein